MTKSNAPASPDERVTALIRSFIWLIVFPAALFLSGWSLYWLMRHWGAPPFVAVFASACTDGVAIYAADQCLDAIKEGSRGTYERLIVLAFALAGAWINRYHAIALGEPLPAQVGWAIPTLAAAVVYDLKHRKVRRRHRARQYERHGVTYPDILTWLFFPLKTWAWTLDLAISRIPAGTGSWPWRRNPALVRPDIGVPRPLITLTPEPNAEISAEPNDAEPEIRAKPKAANPNPANVTNFAPLTGRPSPRVVREWAKKHGWPELGERGRIHQPIWEAYYEAHPHRATAGGD